MRNSLDAFRQENRIYIFAALASICLSIWLYSHVEIVNPDAICYLLSAEAMGAMSFTNATHICNQASWPLYSILIYGLSAFSHVSLLFSAYVIDTLFSLITVVAFLLVVKQLGGSKRTLALAALTILFAHEFNSIRDNVIRDHGFWAFYLLSLLFMLRYYAKPQITTALTWSMCLLIATGFRIEGAVFLFILPFVIFFNNKFSIKQRLLYFISLNSITLVISLCLSIWILLNPSIKVEQLGRLAEISTGMTQHVIDIYQRFAMMKANLAKYVIPSFSASDVNSIWIFVVAGWYLSNVIDTVSWIYFALVLYGLFFVPIRSRVVYAYLLVNLFITFNFLLEHLFLSKRYLIALFLILMLWVPFVLNDLIAKATNMQRRIILYVIALCMVVSACGGLFNFGYSKKFIYQAGDWIAANSTPQTAVYANDYQLMYYSRHFGFDIFAKALDYNQVSSIKDQKWKQFDLLALRINSDNFSDVKKLLQEIKQRPIKVFRNARGDRVAIYKINKEGK